jgi:glutamate racemase
MIGLFDSGVGGMTVARALEELLPHYPLLYFGDIARSPYGSKSPEALSDYCRRNTDFLLQQGAKVVLVACNSAAATSAHILRAEYSVPILDVIGPATAKAAAVSRNGKIGLIGTRATVQSKVYEEGLNRLRPGCQIVSQACPLLVPLVEENWLDRRETKMILRRYLHPLQEQQIDTLILGCTHYPLLRSLIQRRMGKQVRLIDSSVEAAQHLRSFLAQHSPIDAHNSTGRSRFFVSDVTIPVQQLADRIFGRPIHLEKIDV